jgi:hypothetical protein
MCTVKTTKSLGTRTAMFEASMSRRSRAMLTGDATELLRIKMAGISHPDSATVSPTRLESLLGQGGRPHVLDRHVDHKGRDAARNGGCEMVSFPQQLRGAIRCRESWAFSDAERSN